MTFCNPLNLNYAFGGEGDDRHGADPVIVLFQDKYYLFDTHDLRGYRVSDDLVTWKDVLFDAPSLQLATGGQTCLAPAAAVHGGYIYYLNFGGNPSNADPTKGNLIRTRDPLSGRWEKVAEIPGRGDPNLFFDDDGRLYITHGLPTPEIVELNPQDFSEVPGSNKPLIPAQTTLGEIVRGIQRFNRDLGDHLDTAQFFGHMEDIHIREGSWITKYNGKYYLQASSPGTQTMWYHDAVWVADKPTGPYHEADYSPAAMKVGGFIGSSGHSCVFQDKHGNFWRVTTMWIGVKRSFERRIGLFPTGFDAQGRMFTQTLLGDYPIVMPIGGADINQSSLAGWWVQSYNKRCMASSSLPNQGPELASDENVRTWWSARTGDPGEWLQMDLGKRCRINAVQVNFAEQDMKAVTQGNANADDDYHAYKLLASDDGARWRVLVDKSANKTAVPHDYIELKTPERARYLKLENIHSPLGGKFAVRDLRVFGHGEGKIPARVQGFQVQRHEDDDRNVTFSWQTVDGADGYIIRYGVAPDALHLGFQVQGGQQTRVTNHILNHGTKYWYRIDAFNGSGLSQGQLVHDPTG